MATPTIEAARVVTGGIDTHSEAHMAAAVDCVGGVLGTQSFPATPQGYQALFAWLGAFGELERVGIEGTGAYGAGITRFLVRRGIGVVEVDRPNRQARRRQGKSDPLDAIEAARCALSGRAGAAKARDGAVEAIRVLLVAHRSGSQARVKTLVQMRHLVYTAPDALRTRLQGLRIAALVAEAAALRPVRSPDQVSAATKAALRCLALRVRALEVERQALDQLLEPLVAARAPGSSPWSA